MTKPLSLYITHGTLIAIRALDRFFKQKSDECSILVLFKNDNYEIYKESAVTLRNLGIEVSEGAYSYDQLVALIHYVKGHSEISKTEMKLSCDANLGDYGGFFPTSLLNRWIHVFKPGELILFHDTVQCQPNIDAYLRGEPCLTQAGERIQLPIECMRGWSGERQKLQAMVADNLHKSEIGQHFSIRKTRSESTQFSSDESVRLPHQKARLESLERLVSGWFSTAIHSVKLPRKRVHSLEESLEVKSGFNVVRSPSPHHRYSIMGGRRTSAVATDADVDLNFGL